MIKSAEEAREMVEKGKIAGFPTPIADGYLAALEGEEVRALVDLVDEFTGFTNVEVSFHERCCEALSAFNKAVKP